MNFIKDVCAGKKDEYIHRQFVRLGKGNYDRFLMSITKGKDLKIKTSFDMSNFLFGLVASLAKENVEVSGKIIANYDFEKEIEAVKFSKRGKLYTAELKKTCSPEELQELFDTFKMQYILLNVKGKNIKLKSGKSLPKPGGTLKDNFCSVTLPIDLLDEFAFDFDPNFKKATIVHKIVVKEIIIPKEYENDFGQARLHGIRKGTLIREIDLDGNKVTKEYALEV